LPRRGVWSRWRGNGRHGLAWRKCPALLALGLARRGRGLDAAALILAVGTLVFVGDLALREYFGQALFPGAAPLGGGTMMIGWGAIVFWGLFAKFVRI
jgi:uncharacterized membrane protein YgdD (TMEM256/DUF423 family)